MCMKYVNASAKCFKSITIAGNSVVSYDIPFTSIRHDDGVSMSIGKFSVVTNIDFLGTANEEHKSENPLESRKTLDFIIRLTKCDTEKEKRLGYDLDSFSINLSDMYDNNQVSMACFGFLNYTRTTNIDRIALPGGTGKYVIKILIKDSLEDDYTIQSMSQLVIL